MSDTRQVTELLTIISRLSNVLEREIDMLRAMKPSELQSLQQDKIVLSAAYEANLKALSEQPEALQKLDPTLRARLKAAVEKFQATLAENERSLRAARDVTDRVLRTIAEELSKRRNETGVYGAGGVPTTPRRATLGEPVSVAVDQRL